MAETSSQPAAKKSSKLKKILLIGGGGVVVVIALVLALAPTIAGSVAPGIIESKAGEAIPGHVKVSKTSFSWGGPQVIGPLTLTDPNGKEVATLEFQASRGLMALAMNPLNTGEVVITGKADIVREADGTTNIERATVKPKPAGSGGGGASAPSNAPSSETKVPAGLKANIIVKALQVTYTDKTPGGASVALKDVNLNADVATGGPLNIDLSAKATQSASGAPATPGNVAVKAKIDNWSDASGRLTTDASTIDANVDIKSLPSALLEAFAGSAVQSGQLTRGLGDTVDLTIKAKGTMKDAKANLALAAQQMTANADVQYAANQLITSSPIQIQIKGAGLKALVPQIDAGLKEQNATLAQMPDVAITIDKLKVPYTIGAKSLDLRGMTADAIVALTPLRGTIKLDANAPTSPFTISALEARLATDDIAKGAHLTAKTDATLDGKPAGNVDVDLRVAGLLNDKGAPAGGLPTSIQGKAMIKSIATAIAQPFVSGLKLDLPADLGPTLDVEVMANSSPNAATTGGAIPPTDLDITIRSAGAQVAGALQIDDKSLRSRGQGLRVDLPRAGSLASRFVAPSTGWQVASPAATATVNIKTLNVPLVNNKPQLAKSVANVDVNLANWSVRSLAKAGSPPVDVQGFTLHLDKQATGAAHADLNGSMAHAGSPFTMNGGFDITGLFDSKGELTPALARPVGKVEIKTLPTALAGLFSPAADPATPSVKPLDLGKLVQDVAGRSANVTINSNAGAGPQSIAMDLTLRADRLAVDGGIDAAANEIKLRGLGTVVQLSPETVQGLLATFAPDVKGVPRLAGVSNLVINVAPLTLPLTADGKPDFAKAGIAAAEIKVQGKSIVDGLTMQNADGTTRPLGQVGIEDLSIEARAPLAALMGPVASGKGETTARLAGKVLGPNNAAIATLSGDVNAQVSEGKPAGALAANIKLAGIDTRAVENMLGQQGMLTGSMGDSLTVETKTTLAPPASAKAGQAFDFNQASINIETALTAPRLKTNGPLKLAVLPERLALSSPANLQLNADPSFVNRFLNPPPKAGAKPNANTLTLRQPANVTVAINKLALSRATPVAAGAKPPQGATLGPLKAGVFDLALNVAIPALAMGMTDGTAMNISNVSVNAQSGSGTGSPITFDVNIAQATVADRPPANNLKIAGNITDLASPAGEVQMDKARLTARGNLANIPTPLVDALAKQNGLLVDALGPTVSLELNANNFSLGGAPGGTLDIQTNSERVTSKIKGVTQDGAFVSQEPINVSILEISKALGARIVDGMPVVGSFEKSKDDKAGVITATNMRVPLDNDLRKLNGVVRLDLGTAKFGASDTFSKILQAVKIKDAGSIGRKLPPLDVTFTNGIATYPKYKLPLGEFTVETEGTIDMVNKHIDVVTWMPFGAVTEEATGLFKVKTGIGGLLNKIPVFNEATMLPFRTKGPLDKPTTAPDLELFAKNAVSNVVNPGDIGGKVEDLLKDVLKKPKK